MTSSDNSKAPVQIMQVALVSALLIIGAFAFYQTKLTYGFDITQPFTIAGMTGLFAMLVPFALCWLFMSWHGQSFVSYGLTLNRTSVVKVVLQTVLVLLVTFLSFRYLLQPLAMQFSTQRPDLSHIMNIPGNLPGLIIALVMMWITAAFLEELLFRGYLMNEVIRLVGDHWLGKSVAVITSSLVFGVSHWYQGLSGMIMTGGAAVILAILYLCLKRNLWPLILAHGLFNSYQLYKVYQMTPAS